MRDTLSHIDRSGTTNALASSETSRVTTETTIGSAAGENSKQNFAQCCSSTHSEQHAGVVLRLEVHLTRALSWKSPVGRCPDQRRAR